MSGRLKSLLRRNAAPACTLGAFVLLFGLASVLYPGFGSLRVAGGLFGDNAVLGITAVGMTLVIFCGGVDLSVGAISGCVGILVATLIRSLHLHPALAWGLALLAGSLFGAAQGWLIASLRVPAFLATLAGMFLVRGLAFWIDTDSVGIGHPLYRRISDFRLELGGGLQVSAPALAFVAVAAVGFALAHHLRFGRTLLAIGGGESSALLMGLPVRGAKLAVYAASGACAALAGIVGTWYTGSGNPGSGLGLELDAIAAVVIGGTLLTGGRGHMLGTVLGVLICGTIQSAILFDGRLSLWWVRIAFGGLLLGFILVQRGFSRLRAA
jgi:simple sugar transport system permease protein